MKRNSFGEGFIKGCGFMVGVGVIVGVIWLGYSLIAKDLVNCGISYFAAKCIPTANAAHNVTTSAQNISSIGVGTIYEATISYYNQIISILIFIAGFAGVIAFGHIGIISKERAEEIAETCVSKEVQHKFESQVFYESITSNVEKIFADNEFKNVGEAVEILKEQVESLQGKYDYHDDLLQIERERELGEQEVKNIRDDHEGNE